MADDPRAEIEAGWIEQQRILSGRLDDTRAMLAARELYYAGLSWVVSDLVKTYDERGETGTIARLLALADDLAGRNEPPLTVQEVELLRWLGQEDYSQFGEIHGYALDTLIRRGLAQVHRPGEHQNFVANDPAGTKGQMYRAVSLTSIGRAILRRRLETINAGA